MSTQEHSKNAESPRDKGRLDFWDMDNTLGPDDDGLEAELQSMITEVREWEKELLNNVDADWLGEPY